MLGSFHFLNENLSSFLFDYQNENQRFSDKVITFLKTWALIPSQVKTTILKTLKVIT
jgi:hypothetical protein